MRHVLVRVDFFSPYSSVQYFSEHGRGPPLPPPSTLIGALAAAIYYPVEREVEPGFVSKFKYVTFWAAPYFTVENISRHFTVYSQRKKRIEVLGAAMKIATTGTADDEERKVLKNYGNIDNIDKYLEKGVEAAARAAVQTLTSPATRLETYFSDSCYVLYILDDDLAAPAGGIFRIGPKEALVAATPLEAKVERLNAREVETRFYFPAEAADAVGCQRAWMYEKPPSDPSKEPPKAYCIPHPGGNIRAEPREGWASVVVKTSDIELPALLPEYVAP